MHMMDKLSDTLEKELEKIAEKGAINETDLNHVDKLTHSIKSIETIQAMRDSGYSSEYPYYSNENSYGGGNSYRNQRRDSRGRYSRDDGYSNRRYGRDGDGDGRYYESRYSREDGSMREKLEHMLNEATNETEREAIRQAMSRM